MQRACEIITASGPLIEANTSSLVFSTSRLSMSLGLLLSVFEQLNIQRLALVCFGMKDVHYMNDVNHIPLSDDATVYRRFDIGIEFPNEEIPFFAFDSDAYPELRVKVHHMCGVLGAGGGSIKHQYITDNIAIEKAMVKVYPLVVHEIKMKLKGNKALPATIQGTIDSMFFAIYY